MNRDQQQMPLLQRLTEFADRQTMSFHVPGHKNGEVFPGDAQRFFHSILPIDMTELPGLDDLHAPREVIAQAEALTSDYFHADHSFFLIGGSTVGNLAMILASCSPGEKIIIQRNSHKSMMNGLELADANPVFIAPEYDEVVDRYTHPSVETLEEALEANPDAKAVVLTYPDYFGNTYDIQKMIDLAHAYQIPVLVDEAHGVHFSLGDPFPASALDLGADVVVQSAHKMAPAMTMASYLHIKSSLIAKERVAHYLQMLQSSSPSYPLMASLDVARAFLATLASDRLTAIFKSATRVRKILQTFDGCAILPVTAKDDPLKITLHVKQGISSSSVANIFEQAGIYPELITHNQLLFIHGLAPFNKLAELKKAIESGNEQLKINTNHDTIEITELFPRKIQGLAMSYQAMNAGEYIATPLKEAIGKVAAEAVIPYPPGIPLILKGEKINTAHILVMEQCIKQGVTFQNYDIDKGINVYTGVR